MEALIKRYSLLFAAMVMSFGSLQAQEVDDMYFTKKDREKLNEQKVSINKNMPSAQNEEATEHVYNNENAYSEEHVNPEYLARYGNPTNTPAGEDEYFTDQTTSGNISQPPVVNNYYYNTPRPYFAPSFGMGYSPWGWNYGFGMTFGYGSFMPRYGWGGWYDPWMDPWMNPWGPRWSVSMSFGYGWGSPYGYYDPFYRRNPWGWGGVGAGAWGYCPPGYGGNIVIINDYESRYNRTFRAGSGPSRSNVDRLAQRGGSTGSEGSGFSSRTGDFNNKAVTPSRVASASAVPTRRNISNSSRGTTQSDYYRRSQSSRTISNDIVSRATRSRSEFSSPNSNYSTRSRVASSGSGSVSGLRPATTNSRVTSGNRPSSTSTYRPRSSSNTGRSFNGYSAPSRSSGSRYGTPSRGRTSSPSFNRSSSPSRSSGSFRSSSPSRSSGSFSAPSRSSGSSGSRSSGASRSSGSRSSSGVRRSN